MKKAGKIYEAGNICEAERVTKVDGVEYVGGKCLGSCVPRVCRVCEAGNVCEAERVTKVDGIEYNDEISQAAEDYATASFDWLDPEDFI